jgi:hypothetical protein
VEKKILFRICNSLTSSNACHGRDAVMRKILLVSVFLYCTVIVSPAL